MIALALCEASAGAVVNIGTGSEWSIEQTAQVLMKITGCSVPIRCDESRVRPENSEVSRLIADNQRPRELTGWQPEVGFRAGLERTVERIVRNLHHFDPGHYAV